jgi:hypothetical protein
MLGSSHHYTSRKVHSLFSQTPGLGYCDVVAVYDTVYELPV